MTFPALACLAVLLFSLTRPLRVLLAVAYCFSAFGALALIPVELTGGTSLLAGTVAFILLIGKVLLSNSGSAAAVDVAIDHRRLGLLSMFTIVVIIGAVILPRMFDGLIYVFPMRSTAIGSIPETVQPTTANFTQAAYLTVSFLTAVSFASLVRRKRFVEEFGTAILYGAVAVIVTGAMDLVADGAGLGDMLSGFRTASYAFLNDVEVVGVKRTIGLMPEASSFGGLAGSYFALLLFTRNMFSPRLRKRLVWPVIGGCAVFAALSTSSAAYVGLVVTGVVYACDGARRLGFGDRFEKKTIARELALLGSLFVIGFFLMMFFDTPRQLIFDVVDQMVFKKTESASFEERSSWTSQAFQAWLDTYGFGVGAGSVRTSNFFVNILASTGFVGALLFGMFLFRIFTTTTLGHDPRFLELARGAKLALIPGFVGGALAGTTPDYGTSTGALFGIVVGIGAFRSARPRYRGKMVSKIARFSPILKE